MASSRQVGFIGCGKMGGALAIAMAEKGAVALSHLHLFDVAPAAVEAIRQRLNGGRAAPSAAELCRRSDVVLLAVKPQDVGRLLQEIAPDSGSVAVFVSIAAGVSLAALRRGLGPGPELVRAMPNRPALVARGITGVMGDATTSEATLAEVETFFRAAGGCVRLTDEALFDGVTALSGSGPAFVYRMMEGLIEGGVRAGLPEATASELTVATVLGAAQLLFELGTSPVEERKAVSSPGGTTVAGLAELDARDFTGALVAAVVAAAARSRELGA